MITAFTTAAGGASGAACGARAGLSQRTRRIAMDHGLIPVGHHRGSGFVMSPDSPEVPDDSGSRSGLQ